VKEAIERAEKLNIHPIDRWPNQLGTQVYKLVKKIVPSSKVAL